jgi:DNA repair exonuclease SbcCD ATPase subunit
MERDELKTQVSALVASLFDEKEDAEIRSATEAELEKAASAISDLTTALEDKNTEVAEVDEKLTASDARVKELESELEAAKTELETANEKLGKSEQALEDMNKDRAAEVRMAELEDAGVARSDKEDQMAKVRDMSDEDFASYKGELVSIREAIVAELKQSEEKAGADAKAEAEAEEAKKMKEDKLEEEKKAKMKKDKKEKSETSEETSEESETSEEEASEELEEEAAEEDETTPPVQITPGQAAMASLNMEYIPSEDLMTKYAKLGEAMAKRFKKSDE